jgi:hypothetical protein
MKTRLSKQRLRMACFAHAHIAPQVDEGDEPRRKKKLGKPPATQPSSGGAWCAAPPL